MKRIHKIKANLAKARSLARTSTGRARLWERIAEKLFSLTIPLTIICRGWSFSKPRMVAIEPTNRCNINCVMCARRYWDEEKNPPGDMSMELFDTRILPFLRPRQHVNLQLFGEPLLGKHFLEMLHGCHKKRCKVSLTTNGILLKNFARKLVESEVDTITISIDGIKSLEDIRGIEVDSIIGGIRELNSLKQEQTLEYPTIKIAFVAMKDNVSELPQLVDLAHELEIKTINVFHAVIHSQQLADQSLFAHPDMAHRHFEEASRKAENLDVQLFLPPTEETTAFCSQPFESIHINWNGDVRPCCIATTYEESTLMLGNLEEKPLLELWNCRQMRKLRMSLFTRKRLHDLCQTCRIRISSYEAYTRILKNG